MRAGRRLAAFGTTAALALAGILVPAAAAQASSLCGNPLSSQYRIQNVASGYYLTSEGRKAQMKTTGKASTFNVYECSTGVYQFEIAGSNSLCIEYSGSVESGTVIADTCYSTRASQQWSTKLPGNDELIQAYYGGLPSMYAAGVTDGSKVDASAFMEPNTDWKVYKHSA
jgi:hypothetical protein